MSGRPIVGGAGHAMFTLPRASLWHLYEIVRDYEYAEMPRFDKPLHVIDLGAHVGAFSLLALSWWPGATIDAYEPHPLLCDLLRRNVAGEAVEVHERAVLGLRDIERLAQGPWVPLWEGKRTLLGSSCKDMGWQRTEERPLRVKALPATELPPCDVLKIDIEGAEKDVLDYYPHAPRLVMCELHDEHTAFVAGERFKEWGLERVRLTPGRGGARTEVWSRP